MSADLVESQESQDSADLLPRAPLLDQLLPTERWRRCSEGVPFISPHHSYSLILPPPSSGLLLVSSGAYLQQVSALLGQTQVVWHQLVCVPQDSTDDRGLGETRQQLWKEKRKERER